MLKGRQILVLEDEVLLRKSLVGYLESAGADVFSAGSIAEALNIRESTELDFALLDINLPDGNGLDLLDRAGFSQTTQIVMMTADGGIRTAIEAMKRGAGDYLSKPFDPEELPMVFSRLSKESASRRQQEFERQTRSDLSQSLFTGSRLQHVQELLDKILKADIRLGTSLPPVLIEGETGTGKSTLARWLHEKGPRREASLVEINCSSLPDSLAESELFGHERGAFTDARKERIGLFEAADGGSLFLDEIASLSPKIQAKVLTAIEDGKIRRLGGNTQRGIDARLIAASLLPLDKLVKDGGFREDLYHRLNLLHIRIPSLREYPDDLPALARHILESLKKRYRLKDVTISPAGMDRIMGYSWPGNVRELLHEIERAIIFHDSGPLDFTTLGENADTPAKPVDSTSLRNPLWKIPDSGFQFEDALSQLSKDVIEEALASENGNVSAAARRLGVSRDFIRYRVDS